jgi:hypothetical protein
METKTAAIHQKIPILARQLPITGSAHKAGVVGAADQPAVGTVLDMPAQRRRPARFDRRHDTAFGAAEMGRVGLAERRAVVAEDVRHLQCGAHRAGSGGRCELQPQPVERALCATNGAGCDQGVARRGLQVAVAEQGLDDADVGAALQQMRGEAVPQRVHGDPLVELCRGAGGTAGHMQTFRVQRTRRVTAGEQPMGWPRQPPVAPQDAEQLRRQHDIAVFAALALLDAEHHPAAVDVGELEAGHLRRTQSGGPRVRPRPARGQAPAVVSAIRCFRLATASRKRTTSPALSTTGSLRGWRAYAIRSGRSVRPRVVP